MKLNIGIFGIALINLTSAFMFPILTETRYNYKAISKVLTIEPQLLKSQYEISMEIIVMMFNSEILVRLENIRYTTLVGAENDSSEEAIPDDRIRVLQLPVLIEDEMNDRWIKFDKRDQPWSAKIKKDLLFMLNVNKQCLRIGLNKSCSSENFFGNNNGCHMTYKVINRTQTDQGFEYLLKYDFLAHQFGNICELVSNVESNFNFKYHNLKEPSNIYTIDNEILAFQSSESTYLRNITWKSVYKMPYSTFILNSSQHITFNSSKKISRAERFYYFDEPDSTPEISENVEICIHRIKKKLESIVDCIETMEIELFEVMEVCHDDIFFVIENLKILEEKDLVRIYNYISNKKERIEHFRNIFSMILPAVETKHAVMIIRNLILNKLVDEESAIRILVNMPKAAISGTSFFMLELEELINVDNGLSERLRGVATLAIASTISTRVKNVQGILNSTLDEYATNASKKILTTGFHNEVILLVSALSNMQTNNIISILQGIIGATGENSRLSPHVRSIAMLSLVQELPFGDDRQDRLSPMLMKILKGKTENIEIRLMAVNILMEILRGDKLVDLFSYMVTEMNEEIRGLFYYALKNIAESTVEYFGDRVETAKQLLKDMPDCYKKKSPNKKILLDFIDSLKNYGFAWNYVVMGDLNEYKFLTLIMKEYFAAHGAIFNQEAIYLHIRLREDYNKYVNLDLYTLGNMVPEDLHIELIVFKKQMVTFAEYLKPSELIQLITNGFTSLNGKSTYILRGFENYRETLFVHSGVSFVEYFSALKIVNIKAENISVGPDNYSCDIMHKSLNNIKYGLNVYNPLSENWHGMQRVQKVDVLLGTKFKIEINSTRGQIHIDWDPINNKSQTVGFRSTGRTEAVIFGNNSKKIFQQSYSIGNKTKVLIKNRINLTIWEYDDETTGLLYQFKIFDCEKDDIAVHKFHFKKIIKERMKSLSWKNVYLVIQNLWAYVTLLPGNLNCGIGFSAQKSKNYPMTHLKLKIAHFKLDFENTELSLDIMHNDTSVKSLNMSVLKETHLNKYDIIIKRSTETDICIRVTGNFEGLRYISQLKIFKNANCYSNDSNFSVEMVSTEEKRAVYDLKRDYDMYKNCILKPEYSFATCVTQATVMRTCYLNIFSDFDLRGVWKDLYVSLKDMYGIKSNNFRQNKPGNINIVFKHLLPEAEKFDMSFKGFSESFDITDVQLDHTQFPSLLEPRSYFDFVNSLWMEECQVESGKLTLEGGAVRTFNICSDWKMILSDCYNSKNSSYCLWSIFVRVLNPDNNVISLRITTEEEELVYEFDGEIQMYLNKQNVGEDAESYFVSKSTEYRYLYRNYVILIHLKGTSTVIGFDGLSVKIASNMENLFGLCNRRYNI